MNASLETISGEYVGQGAICPQFRLTSGETISLSGDHAALVKGERISLQGTWRTRSKCMQGREFRVQDSET